MIQNKNYNSLLEYETLRKYESLIAFTTTIEGGVSTGNYTSFNLGEYSGDSIENVSMNRERLADMLSVSMDQMYFPYQTHGDNICVIDSGFLSEDKEQRKKLLHGVDAVITNQKGICIGVGTADCVPILIYDPSLKILAAVHAGWRGTVAKLAEKTVFEMIRLFGCKSADLVAVIGPSISQEYFEVGEEVVYHFIDAGFCISDIGQRNKSTDKWHIDLWKSNQVLLENAGLSPHNIDISGMCTYSNDELFFSARRQTICSGRIVTGGIIGL